MALFSITDAQLAFGHVALLDHTDFSLEAGERVGLIGRNGTGKSSLLKIVAGMTAPDDGLIARQSGVTSAYVPQEPVFDPDQTVAEAVAMGVPHAAGLLAEYEALVTSMGDSHDDGELHRLHALQAQLEAADAWQLHTRVDTTIAQLGLQPGARIGSLSGGLTKRVALAQALVGAPDILLLDEPTNHLDYDSIRWLEDLLLTFRGSVLFITHDRAFLDRVATRIIELDRGKLRSYPGNFTAYQTRKAQQLEAEALENARFDKLLAQEEVWIRKGVEARRTRSVGRVARLEQMRVDRAVRREVQGNVKLEVSQGDRSGKIVAELIDVTKGYGDNTVVDNFTGTILRGDKVGLLGPNGVGKTTLLKLILGELSPDTGTVRNGTNLQVAYFDQMRTQLDLNRSLADTISPGSDWIEVNGQRKHVMSYLATSCSRRSVRARRCRRCRAASATGCCWRACSRGRPTCWCWTSRPTTSTSTRWSCSKNCCRNTAARCSWSRTTAPSSTTSSPRLSRPRARAAGANTWAGSRTGRRSRCARRGWRRPPSPSPKRRSPRRPARASAPWSSSATRNSVSWTRCPPVSRRWRSSRSRSAPSWKTARSTDVIRSAPRSWPSATRRSSWSCWRCWSAGKRSKASAPARRDAPVVRQYVTGMSATRRISG